MYMGRKCWSFLVWLQVKCQYCCQAVASVAPVGVSVTYDQCMRRENHKDVSREL